MKTTKKHISLKTAKLLKDCGVESKCCYFKDINGYRIEKTKIVIQILNGFSGKYNNNSKTDDIYPVLQQKKYEEADDYFRKVCVLIKL